MTLALPDLDPPGRGRWPASLCAVLALHAAAAGLAASRAPVPPPPEAPEAIMVDLAPAPRPPEPSLPDPSSEATPPEPDPPPPEPVPIPVAAPPPAIEPLPVAEVAVPPPKTKPKPVGRRPLHAVEPPPHRAAEASPAPATPAPVVAPAEPPASTLAPWRGALLRHLERFKHYPRPAQLQRLEGVAQVRVTLARDGSVLAVQLERGSGHAALDGETVAMVRRASPLPAPPPEMASERIELVVPVEFALR